MQITWTPTGGSAITLCHGTERGSGKATGPFNESGNPIQNTQVVKRIRTEGATLYDRGNMLNEYSFSVNETYASIAAARASFHKRRNEIGRTGKLIIVNDSNIEYQDAILEITLPKKLGISLVWTYKVISPKIV